jgi:steroid delta-isomerase-like uncharacterized protein
MMATSNKEVVRRLYNEVWNERKWNVTEEIISKSHALNAAPTSTGSEVGPAAYNSQVQQFIRALPDLRFSVEDCICDKDKVVIVWTLTGTHRGELLGIAPTNKKVSVHGITIHQLASGKILDSQVVWDAHGLMVQLGVPQPAKMEARSAAVR